MPLYTRVGGLCVDQLHGVGDDRVHLVAVHLVAVHLVASVVSSCSPGEHTSIRLREIFSAKAENAWNRRLFVPIIFLDSRGIARKKMPIDLRSRYARRSYHPPPIIRVTTRTGVTPPV